MDLLCFENHNELRAEMDPVLTTDTRVLTALLLTEARYAITCNYFKQVQQELTPAMRKTCASWMMEVCDEERCEDSIFPTAMNFLDRFLSLRNVEKTNLQLFACVSLLIASKIRQATPLNVKKLAYYTDDAYTASEIMQGEMLVLRTLKWDIGVVIPGDFLDVILSRLPLAEYYPSVRKHSLVFLQMCSLNFEFCSWLSSIVTLGCVGAAINGLRTFRKVWKNLGELASSLHEISGVDKILIEYCITQVEQQVTNHVLESVYENSSEKVTSQCPTVAYQPAKNEQQYVENRVELPPETLPETPTDVQSVMLDNDM